MDIQCKLLHKVNHPQDQELLSAFKSWQELHLPRDTQVLCNLAETVICCTTYVHIYATWQKLSSATLHAHLYKLAGTISSTPLHTHLHSLAGTVVLRVTYLYTAFYGSDCHLPWYTCILHLLAGSVVYFLTSICMVIEHTSTVILHY